MTSDNPILTAELHTSYQPLATCTGLQGSGTRHRLKSRALGDWNCGEMKKPAAGALKDRDPIHPQVTKAS